MAMLVLLAAAAGARIVAADVGEHGAVANNLGLRRFRVGAEAAGIGVLELHLPGLRLERRTLLRLRRGDLFLAADAHAREQRDDLALHLLQHVAEEFEGFLLVLLLR